MTREAPRFDCSKLHRQGKEHRPHFARHERRPVILIAGLTQRLHELLLSESRRQIADDDFASFWLPSQAAVHGNS